MLSPTTYSDCSCTAIEDLLEKVERSTISALCEVVLSKTCNLFSMSSKRLVTLSWNCSIICFNS